tara:strand:+ start:691 stop:999 length:309 start_codon:yes stop_codon:yes gene_type:complete
MSFKLTSPFKKHATPIVHIPLENDVMGRADKRGNILLNKDMNNQKDIIDTINHEEVHIKQMASGDLDYDEQNVYFKGKKYPRSEFNDSNKKLPWEIDAYKAG